MSCSASRSFSGEKVRVSDDHHVQELRRRRVDGIRLDGSCWTETTDINAALFDCAAEIQARSPSSIRGR